jgi:hypothetical protein
MRIRPRSRPRHCKSAKVGDFHGFGDMDSGHGTWTFNKDVGMFAGVPGGQEEIIEPSAEFGGSFLEEGDCEHAMFNTDSH